MRILFHDESHIVGLDDGSRWRVYPGDLNLTLNWQPETELTVVPVFDQLSSHILAGGGGSVRVIPADQNWPDGEIKAKLKEG